MIEKLASCVGRTFSIINIFKLSFLVFVCSFIGTSLAWISGHFDHKYTTNVIVGFGIFVIINGFVLIISFIEYGEL